VLYEFTFVVEGADPDDNEVIEILTERLDATLARGAGVGLLTIEADGKSALDAAGNAMTSAEHLVPQIRFVHLDRDLVGISEIAERTGRSRQNVAQWVSGERHAVAAVPFPKVEGVVGRARIWLWSEVNAWLRSTLSLGDEICGPSRDEITDIDFFISHRSSSVHQRRSHIDFTWPLVAWTVDGELKQLVPRAPSFSFLTSQAAPSMIVKNLSIIAPNYYHEPEERPETRVIISNVRGGLS
jgi:predicted DNA-binding transcriptional regulator AlpA